MANIFWNVTTNGNWTDAADWSPETVPGAGDDAVLGVTGFAIVESYTVSVTTSISVNSITISDADAVLSIASPGIASVATNVENAGDIDLQNGGELDIKGNLSNLSTSEGTAVVNVDTQTNNGSSGGSALTATGTLDNTGAFNIGNSALTAQSLVTVGAIENSGVINLTGNSSVGNTEQAVLDVLSAAPSSWSGGTLTLAGQSLLEFSSGSIGGIAQGAEIYLATSDGYVADKGSTSSNSALTELSSVAGDFELQYGAQVSVDHDLDVTGSLEVDTQTDYGDNFSGGSALAISGTLTNSGTVSIGGTFLFGGGITATSTIRAGALDNTGTINLLGNPTIGSAKQAVLDIKSAAPTTWTGTVTLAGEALLEFGSGEIVDIAQKAEIYLASPDGYIADASATSSNSALTGLNSVAGDFELQYGAQVSVDHDLDVTGSLEVDTQTDYGDNFSGGSGLAISGTLTNSGTVSIGGTFLFGGGITATSTISAGSLDNSGTINLLGNPTIGSAKQAVLNIKSAAPTTWTGTITLGGEALLEFASGQITTVAKGAEIYLASPDGYIADAGSNSSNSALTGLNSVAGDFELQYGATVSIDDDLAVTGSLEVDTTTDYNDDPSGGSMLTIVGELTNSGTINIGNDLLTATTLVSAGSLDNTGTINLVGGSAHQTTLDILSAAPSTWTASISLSGEASLEFASGSIQNIAAGATISLSTGTGFIEDAGATGTNSALSGLTANAGGFYVDFGASVSLSGDLSNTGTLGIDEHVLDGFDNSGGSTLKIKGTLTNSATVDIGNYALSGATLVTAGGLDNTSAGTINITGANGNAAIFEVAAAATATWVGTLSLSGTASLQFGSGSIQTIAQGATISLSTGTGFIEDAGATGKNSALTGLTSNAGGFYVDFGASVSLSGDLSNTGTLGVDEHVIDGFDNSGGSTLKIKGTLTNSATVDIGNYALSDPTLVTAGALDNTSAGTINITGANSNAAIFEVAAAATATWVGTLSLSGTASLQFGSGSIQSVAQGATISLSTGTGFIEDAGATGKNSALTGLTSNAGGFYVDFGASVSLSGNLNNTGTLGVDEHVVDGFDNSGGSTLKIAGTLTNSGTVYIGNYALSGTATFAAGAFTNLFGATVSMTGSGSAQADVTVTHALDNAGALTIDNAVSADVGSLTNTGKLNVYGSAGLSTSLEVLGAASNSDDMTIGAYAELGAVGAVTDSGSLNLGGTLDVDDRFEVTATGSLTMQGGEVVTPNAASVTVDTGGTVTGDGTIATTLVNNATVTASGGLLDVSGAISGSGALAVAAGSELELGGATAQTVGFGGNVGTLRLDQPGNLTGSITGLVQGDTIDLAGVQATSAVVNGSTLTVTAGSQTFSYRVSGPGLAGNTFALEDDQNGGTDLVLGPPGPTISGPTTQTAFLGWPSVLGPLTIADPNAGTGLLTVTITAGSGSLSGVDINGNPLNGNGGNRLVLTGDLADINTMLASVAYNGVTAGATDNVQVAVTDASNATAAQTIAVTTDTVPFTTLVLNELASIYVIANTPTAIPGISISDPYAQQTGQQEGITFGVLGANATLTAGGQGGTVTGQGSSVLGITGTVQSINSYFADSLQEALLPGGFTVPAAQAGIVGNVTATQAPVIAADIAAAEENVLLGQTLQAAIRTLTKKLIATYGNNIATQFVKNIAVEGLTSSQIVRYLYIIRAAVNGFTHLTTSDGQLVELDASGEFTFLQSTNPGDSFQVQVRLQPVNGSSSVSEMTGIAAAVGSDTVTFSLGRSSLVWIDGSPVTLNPASPTMLAGGEVSQIGPETYTVSWNTGESITIVNNGSFLGLQESSSNTSFVGLGGNLTLPDGTALQEPLTSAELNSFANAWRVTSATSLFDPGPTFTDTSFPENPITLSDLPANVVAAAAQAVAATGITDAGAIAAMEYDYIASGGDPTVLASDASAFQGVSATPVSVTESGPAPAVLGVIAPASAVQQAQSGPTAVTFDVYLTAPESNDTEVDYAVVDSSADDFTAADFGGTLPSGSITIAAGKTAGTITIDVPQGALGDLPSEDVALQISSPGGVPIFAPTSVEEVTQATATAPTPSAKAVPELEYLGAVGTFGGSGDDYTLNLGDIQFGETLPALQFGVANANSSPGDELGGSFSWPTVAGYDVTVNGDDQSGASLTSSIAAGSSDQALTVTTDQDKFGAQDEVITFTPVDTNASGYSEQLSPIKLTITDTLEVPGMIYSQAWGDVHIITYNGLHYNFQAAGEFTLAKSNIADDSFDIQLRLQPYNSSASVTTIQQVAASLGDDRVTFGVTGFDRAATVLVDGNVTTLSMADPTLTLAGGTITEVSPSLWKVAWNTGESMTVTESSGFLGFPYFNVSDSVPYASEGEISGLQGENEGTQNDFQLPDGTVLPQPLTSAELYGKYADGWRVTPTTSLFDYGPGQTTATFTDLNFPPDQITLADLPASVVAHAAVLVKAAGITDPVTAQNAELDYIATGDPSFISTAANVNQQVTDTVAPTITPSTTPTAAIGVAATETSVTEAASGVTAVTFTAYLTAAEATATTVDYAVVDSDSSDLDAAAFGGVLPSGAITIAAGQTTGQITIDVPQGALGAMPDANVQVQVSSPGDALSIFAPTAQTEIVNDKPEAGTLADPVLAYLGNLGTFTFDQTTETYTLNLGGVTQGAAVVAAEFAVVNAATGPSDNLSGTFTPPTGQGFIVTGDNLPTPLGAGEVYQGLYTSIDTADLGSNEISLTFDPEDVNDSGYSSALTPIKLDIVDTVTPPAQPKVDTPTTIIFPDAHVGATDSQHVSVTNSAAAGAQSLDVTLTASGNATASGAISQLAPGSTDASDLTVGIDTSAAGAQSGSVTESFSSDPNGVGSSPIATEDPYIDVFGDVYRLADPSVTPSDLTVHVGASDDQTLTITNIDPNDGYSENLIATVVGTTGAVTASGTTGDIDPQADGSIAVHFSTATAGPVGTVTLDLKSDGTGIDGLGMSDLGDVTIPIAVTSENVPAAAQFEEVSGGGTFAQNGSAYSLNLGTITAPTTVSLGVLNSAIAPADTLSGSFETSGPDDFVLSGFGAFSGVAAGQADTAPTVTLLSGQAGTFTETITLLPIDASSNTALPEETLTISGTITTPTPPPVITAPSVADVQVGQASHIASASIADSNSGVSITVLLSDNNGLLSANTNGSGGGGTISGAGSTELTIAGTVAQVNADLTSLSDTDSSSSADAITVSATDSDGGIATPAIIAITANTTPPTVTISPVDGDSVINNAEAKAVAGVPLSGTVTGLAAGATFAVTVTDGAFAKGYTATVNAAGTGWTATIPEADAITLPNGTATVTTRVTDTNGIQSAVANDSVTVAETLPTVTISPVEGDNVIDSAEANAAAGVALGGTVTGIAAGATFSVSVADGAFAKSYSATVNAAGTGWTATIPKADAITLPNGAATVTTQVTDAYGNVSAIADDTVTVAESLPAVTISPVDGDNVIDNAEANAAAGVALSGTVVGLAAGATFSVKVTDGSFDKSFTATVNAADTGWTATLPEADAITLPNGAATVTTQVTDASGNVSAVADDTVTVAESLPAVTISPVDGDNVIDNAEANAAAGVALNGTVTGLAAGATFSVTVTDGSFDQSFTATVNAAGTGWTAILPEADTSMLADGTATVTTQVTDAFGNPSATANDSVTVANTLPTVTISPVDGDNIIDSAEADASGGVPLSGTVSGLAAGATFSVTVTDGSFDKSYTATVNAAETGWTATLPEADASTLAEGTATVTTQVTDAYGNQSLSVDDSVSDTATGTAQGDVHMVAYDGLHYDFQADGSYVLTQSTSPRDSFEIQIETAPYWLNNAASLTTAVAARVGSDVIAFDAAAANPLLVDGVGDTTLNFPGQVQTFAAGKLIELSPTSFQVDWNTGETLTVDDEGVYFNTSVTLGSSDRPGSVQGLLGPDAGQANDIQLPDGTVLSSPNVQQLLGQYAQAWSVTSDDSLFGSITPPQSELDIASGKTVSLGGASSYAVSFTNNAGAGSASPSSLILTAAQEFTGLVAGMDSDDSVDLFNFNSSYSSITAIAGTGAAGTYTDVTITDGDPAYAHPLSATLQLLNQVANQYGLYPSDYSLGSDHSATGGALFQLVAHR